MDTRKPTDVSWYQSRPETSLRLVQQVCPNPDGAIIDVGGGASTLVDSLLAARYRDVTVLDRAASALQASRNRLGDAGSAVEWIVADINDFRLPKAYAVWHDRVVFHLLTSEGQRRLYVANAARSGSGGGHLVIATFATDGPLKCSGLEVARHGAKGLPREFEAFFSLLKAGAKRISRPAVPNRKSSTACFRKTPRAERGALARHALPAARPRYRRRRCR